MPKGPAARILDMTAHLAPGMLSPGPPSLNVLIGGKPAWKGVPASTAAGLQSMKAASQAKVDAAAATTAAATGPALPAAKAAEETLKAAEAAAMSAAIAGAAGGASIHMCVGLVPFPPVPPPHGPGVVIDGSPSVLINGLPACRLGDTILEAFGPTNKIITAEPTVIIGDFGTPTGMSPAAMEMLTAAALDAAAELWDMLNGVPPPAYRTGLGYRVDRIINKSPKLVANLKALEGKTVLMWGKAGGGTFYDPNAVPRTTIVFDPMNANNPEYIAQSAAHESGHALYTQDPYVPMTGLTKDQYVAQNANRNLKDEGEATMTNAEVRKEILDNGGPDIGIAGKQSEDYAKVAEKYPDPADRDKARQEIGDLFADGETPSGDENKGKTYRDYYNKPYEDHWDANNPPPAGAAPPAPAPDDHGPDPHDHGHPH